MGKRSKAVLSKEAVFDEVESKDSSFDVEHNELLNKKKKKKGLKSASSTTTSDKTPTKEMLNFESQAVKSCDYISKKKKNKVNKNVDEDTSEATSTKHKVKKKKSYKISETDVNNQNSREDVKNISSTDVIKQNTVHDDDSTSDNVQNKKNKQTFQHDEMEVKDEDIDNFCDEIDEEDNEQYENWVKLIEEKLNPNKKK
ncbi:protein FAM133A-like [Achroia grisella]|uniref:protein FAM133A-like n=1 Tax=Achroia grisella TaxID=688607 RepID=UPI0027D2E09F|nr:protein FAM133A-like [Achroia grisella]XP_059048691.1 protein FAM133A-like [Achroia grisella]